MNHSAIKLLLSSLAPASRKLYTRAAVLYKNFVIALRSGKSIWPASVSAIVQFIAYLYELDYAPSSVTSFVSALSFIHQLAQYTDPTKHFLVKRVLLGFFKITKIC